METLTTEWLPCLSPVREAKTGIPSVSPAYREIKMEWLWSERPLIIPAHYPGHPLVGGWGEFQMTGVLIHFSNSCKNDKRNSNLFFNNKQCKNETQIRFSKWCENENRKMKFKSVFQSEAKTKKEIRSSNPFFKVKRKRKTKSKIQLRFLMSCENEKCKWHLNSIFPYHRKTVGTKIHPLLWHSKFNR